MKRLGCLALCLLLLAGCAARSRSAAIFAMDTRMELTAYGPQAKEALDAARAEVSRLDALLSAERSGSAIQEINAGAGEAVRVDPEVAELLRRALELYRGTGGALDVTIYPAMEAWGFPSREYRVPGEEELERLRALVDGGAVELLGLENAQSVALRQGMKLDLGAVGKGYAADRIVALWRDMGLTSGLLNLGGNVHCLGAKPDGSDWVIGIRDPEDENGTLCTVTGQDMAVVTSGAYQRNFTQGGVTYHHILDPATCAPADSGAASVTVIGSSGFLCDGLSTALFVMGPDRAADYWRQNRDFEMVYYTQEGELYYTSGLEGRLTPRGGLEGRMLTWESED